MYKKHFSIVRFLSAGVLTLAICLAFASGCSAEDFGWDDGGSDTSQFDYGSFSEPDSGSVLSSGIQGSTDSWSYDSSPSSWDSSSQEPAVLFEEMPVPLASVNSEPDSSYEASSGFQITQSPTVTDEWGGGSESVSSFNQGLSQGVDINGSSWDTDDNVFYSEASVDTTQQGQDWSVSVTQQSDNFAGDPIQSETFSQGTVETPVTVSDPDTTINNGFETPVVDSGSVVIDTFETVTNPESTDVQTVTDTNWETNWDNNSYSNAENNTDTNSETNSEITDVQTVTETNPDSTVTANEPETNDAGMNTESSETPVPAENAETTGQTDSPASETEDVSGSENTAAELKVNANTNGKIIRFSDAVQLIVQIEGGVAPYQVEFKVSRDGEAVYENTIVTSELSASLSCTPGSGAAEFEVNVKDAQDHTAYNSCEFTVTVNEFETEQEWAKSAEVTLTGDFAIDLVNVARTQIGYTESKKNIIEENGKISGYTRYGDFIGSLYTEWCAAFVSFSVRYANLPFADYFRSANVEKLHEQAVALNAYVDAAGYQPKAGDIVFFSQNGNPFSHIGIVESVTSTRIQTVEGNVGNQVVEKTYSLDDEVITGYMSMHTLMNMYGVTPLEMPTVEPADVIEVEPDDEIPDLEPGEVEQIEYDDLPKAVEIIYGEYETRHTGIALKGSVNVRQKPDIKSRKQTDLGKKGSKVHVLGYAIVSDTSEIWYHVNVNGVQGYVLGEFLQVAEDGLASASDDPADEESQENVELPDDTDTAAGVPAELDTENKEAVSAGDVSDATAGTDSTEAPADNAANSNDQIVEITDGADPVEASVDNTMNSGEANEETTDKADSTEASVDNTVNAGEANEETTDGVNPAEASTDNTAVSGETNEETTDGTDPAMVSIDNTVNSGEATAGITETAVDTTDAVDPDGAEENAAQVNASEMPAQNIDEEVSQNTVSEPAADSENTAVSDTVSEEQIVPNAETAGTDVSVPAADPLTAEADSETGTVQSESSSELTSSVNETVGTVLNDGQTAAADSAEQGTEDGTPAAETSEETKDENAFSVDENSPVRAVVDGSSATLIWRLDSVDEHELYAIMDYQNHLTTVVGLSESGVCRVRNLAPGTHPLTVVHCTVIDRVLVYGEPVGTVRVAIGQ